ncbi:hypothetical protein LI142_23205 [Eubacterium limosum]|uniref:Ubiquitin-binding protein n=1 Tax=Eubacterium limosum TaxID=1736 RepID=A0ABT5URI8_EUBLI|nr:hypothetical protein [Eubacterium limosum]MCB6572401.1 hypothetical protein [Eubacterium limosum]MDE1471573.1 hypothetical protein [Eubacterium limosum]
MNITSIIKLIIAIVFFTEELLYILDSKNIVNIQFAKTYFEKRRNDKMFNNMVFALGMIVLLILIFLVK